MNRTQLNELDDGLYIATVKPNEAISFEMSSGSTSGSNIDTTAAYDKPKALVAKERLWAQWGKRNDLPYVLMNLVYNNNLLPGILDTKDQITLGDDLVFYWKRFEGGKIIAEPFDDHELYDWLEMMEAAAYLEEAVIDYNWFVNAFAELRMGNSQGSLKDKITRIRAVEAVDCRAEIMDRKKKRSLNYGIADWKNKPKDVEVVPSYDPDKDQQARRFIVHCKKKSPGNPYYPLPGYIGAQHWIRHANKIPMWKTSNMDNAINIKYHVEIPQKYFLNLYPDSQGYTAKDRQKKYEEKCDEICEYLSGHENVAKAFFTQYAIDPNTGKDLPGWKFTVLKNETNHEAYSKDFEDANSAILSSASVDPSLSGVLTQGKLSSGSEIRLSHEFHSKIKTRYPRKVLLDPLNIAMKINGFNKRKVDGKERQVFLGIQDVEFTTLDKNPTGSKSGI